MEVTMLLCQNKVRLRKVESKSTFLQTSLITNMYFFKISNMDEYQFDSQGTKCAMTQRDSNACEL